MLTGRLNLGRLPVTSFGPAPCIFSMHAWMAVNRHRLRTGKFWCSCGQPGGPFDGASKTFYAHCFHCFNCGWNEWHKNSSHFSSCAVLPTFPFCVQRVFHRSLYGFLFHFSFSIASVVTSHTLTPLALTPLSHLSQPHLSPSHLSHSCTCSHSCSLLLQPVAWQGVLLGVLQLGFVLTCVL